VAQTAHGVGYGAADQRGDRLFAQRTQFEDQRPRRQRAVHEHIRIVGGGADQCDGAVLHIGQQHILLRLVETMDLIHEQHRAGSVLEKFGGLAHRTQPCDIGEHAGGAFKTAEGDPCDHFGERGLAAARRPVKDQVGEPVGLDDAAQQFAGAEDMVLSEHVLQRGGAHAGCQGLPELCGRAVCRAALRGIIAGEQVCVRITHGGKREHAYPA